MAAPNHLRCILLRAILAAAAPVPVPARSAAAAMLRDVPGQPLAASQPGWLDIHHVAADRGNASFVQFPDGTSLLVDAGASLNGTDMLMATRPGTSRRAGEWIGRYVRRHLGRCGLEGLDYLLVTHLHPDHVGDVDGTSPRSRRGPYRLSGVTDVAEQVAVRTLIDRGFPDYDFPSRFVALFADNYRTYVTARMQNGLPAERFHVGGATQVAPRGYRPATVLFSVRNIAANGQVWTGQGNAASDGFPALDKLPRTDWPTENQCSVAIRIGYGRFSYFTAADMTSYTQDGAMYWQNVLGPAARAVGRATVATADHHGMLTDSMATWCARCGRVYG